MFGVLILIGNSHLSLLDSLTFLTKITELFVVCISGKHMCMLEMNECWMKAITLKITHFQYFFCWTPALQQGHMNFGLFIWSIHEVLFSDVLNYFAWRSLQKGRNWDYYFWMKGMARLKIVQKERLIDFEWNKSVLPQWNTHNFKL